ncbi:MAG: type IV pilus secretin PilQ, partial [Candidatus Methylomirabilis sp.]|nr:type IV pilus secretin PilQ [Deltaproteobacteria bacterium]
LNIVAGEDVVGLLTIRLVDVPWDQAFDVILASQDLGMERIGNVVRVAPLDVIRKAEEKRLAASKAKQNTENMVLRVIPVSYVTAEDLQKQVKAVRSPRGTVTVDTRTNSVLYRDVVSKISEVEDLVKVLDAPTRAVHIEARIVEASTNFTRELGIQIGGSNRGIDIESGTLSIVGGRAGPAGAPIDDFAINLPALTGLGTGGALGFLFESKDASLDVRISALESAGKAKLISSPRVTTLDNIEASIKQGESIPFATVSDQGTETQFFEANLELKVTPHVTADERVRLKILITNDNADFSRTTGTGDPSFITQQAQTQVLLDDGETTVIGGIYTQDLNEDGDGVPYLQNIPVLGHMFKKSGVRDESRELIIFITPKIVRPN